MITVQQAEYVTGKAMQKLKVIERDPIYKATYKACIHAGKNKPKAAAHEYGKIAQLGLDNPAKTKLIMQIAEKDYMNDIITLSNGNISQILTRQINTLKTNIALKFNSTFRKHKNEIEDAFKKQHPDSYKSRNKILKKIDSVLVNDITPFARLGRMNINPMSL